MKKTIVSGSLGTWQLLTILVTINVAVVGLSVLAGIREENIETYFDEGSIVTWLSAIQLLAGSIVSATLYRLRSKQLRGWRSPGLIWLLIALGFVFLAADELVQIHENLDIWLHSVLNIQESPITDRIDDAIVGLYGILAAGLVYQYRREIKRHRKVFPFMLSGFAMLSAMIFLDFLTNGDDVLVALLGNDTGLVAKTALEVAEEFCKLMVESLLLTGLYCAFVDEHRLNTKKI